LCGAGEVPSVKIPRSVFLFWQALQYWDVLYELSFAPQTVLAQYRTPAILAGALPV
jgi:hypothetical protein